jgi:hypothetical protein
MHFRTYDTLSNYFYLIDKTRRNYPAFLQRNAALGVFSKISQILQLEKCRIFLNYQPLRAIQF